jgi:hypothetical protein
MNIFEDLIEELKEENLLEETVVETNKTVIAPTVEVKKDAASFAPVKDEILEADYIEPEITGIEPESYSVFTEQNQRQTFVENSPNTVRAASFDDKAANFNSGTVSVQTQPNTASGSEAPAPRVNQAEFFRNRATNEVLALQMVEHVLAGVEREILNVAPKLYDELSVKKALHEFLQISAKTHTPEHAQAEFLLMQETESWYSALTRRDKHITVGHLRRFCENSRPALSPQALVSLARFYRNAPYSESVRSKFDLILTRLYSKETEKGRRALAFDREELLKQIGELYAEWSSIPLYSADEDDSSIVLAAMKVEDFMNEADAAESLEELVKNDFFNRLRVFKESAQENFFAPLLAAAVVESNVRIGNRYVELFEKQKETVEALEEKYGALHEETICEVICKTLVIKDLMNVSTVQAVKLPPPAPKKAPANNETAKQENPKTETVKKAEKQGSGFFRVNKWLAALFVLTMTATLGLYIWVETVSEDAAVSGNVKKVNLDNSSLKEHIQTARISGDTFYGIVAPSWDSLTREKKEQFVSRIMMIGNEKGFVRVNLIDKQGKTVGFASSEKIEISNP